MARFLRTVAPAAALGGLAVVIVGVADPVFAGRDGGDATAAATVVEAPATSTDLGSGASPSDSAAAATCDSGQTITGRDATTPWGPVQVAATVADGVVCEVHAVAWPDQDRRSQQINAYAIPVLDEAASRSGVAFDSVSGATFTSEAYRSSLQSLLDSL
jgi:uncharacterized protein with FMN-binding domain